MRPLKVGRILVRCWFCVVAVGSFYPVLMINYYFICIRILILMLQTMEQQEMEPEHIIAVTKKRRAPPPPNPFTGNVVWFLI